MIRSRKLLLTLAIVPCLAACSGYASNQDASAAAVAPAAAAAPPNTAKLLAREIEAAEAFNKGDGHFFEALLSDRFVMQVDGNRVSKTDLIRIVNGFTCDAKPGWTFSQPQMLRINNDTYVLSYVSDMAGTCTMDGATTDILTPSRVSTVLVRAGDSWQVAFQGQNQIVDPSAPQTTPSKQAPTKDATPGADVSNAAPPPPATQTTDPITTALMAAETRVWDAWKDKDASKITALTANEISFVDLFGNFSATKADILTSWTGSTCNVTGFTLTNGVGTPISPDIGIVTLTGSVTGKCGSLDISGQKIRVNTVYVKDGDDWKWAFGFNSPA